MRTEELLALLFSVLGDSEEYFVSGSLSFLPLLGFYRQPGKDIDVCINADVFYEREKEFRTLGRYHALRLSEVAVANTSAAARLISPKTGFIHIDVDDSLLDISLYRQKKGNITLSFGLGFTLEISGELLKKVRTLEYNGIRYRSAPFEIMLITKSVEYFHAVKYGGADFLSSKHYADVLRMCKAADMDFTERLLKSLKVNWAGQVLPERLERKLNPYGIVSIDGLKRLS